MCKKWKEYDKNVQKNIKKIKNPKIILVNYNVKYNGKEMLDSNGQKIYIKNCKYEKLF